MLQSLYVKNLALIDETEVNFQNGLNILTGETGAGKSILIGSMNLALGAKADKDMIRTGAEYGLVELTFSTDEWLREQIKALDLSVEEDGSLVIQRKITPQKSTLKICGETVSLKQVKDLSAYLIDIHGQHEHQSLLSKSKQIHILDEFSKSKLLTLKQELKKQVQLLHNFRDQIEGMKLDEASRNRELSLLEFEIREISFAELKPDEDIELETKYRKMLHSKKIMEAVSFVYALTGADEKDSAKETISRALRELKTVVSYDEALGDKEQQLIELETLLYDFNKELSLYMDDLEFEQDDFKEVETRLNEMNRLKSKYGKTIEEINLYYEKQNQRFLELQNYEEHLAQLIVDEKQQNEKCKGMAEVISQIRRENGKTLSKDLIQALVDLNFLNVQFEIQIQSHLDKLTENGYDEVEFMISTNPGEPMKPLHQVASGGELSRIMLALKTVLADKDQIDTLIFDEIDSGISGKTAWKVSEKMAELAKKHQIISITHLPQIAAMADNHYVIEKKVEQQKTRTDIMLLDEETSIEELSRMLGGEEITEAVRSNAREMKNQANLKKDR